jgi:hypothetical protein
MTTVNVDRAIAPASPRVMPFARADLPALDDVIEPPRSASEHVRTVGSFGSAEVLPLSRSKVLVGGEGGLVSGRHIGLTQRLHKMRNNGVDAGHRASWPGPGGRMSELHAVVGLANLERLPERMAERQQKFSRRANVPPFLTSMTASCDEYVVAALEQAERAAACCPLDV